MSMRNVGLGWATNILSIESADVVQAIEIDGGRDGGRSGTGKSPYARSCSSRADLRIDEYIDACRAGVPNPPEARPTRPWHTERPLTLRSPLSTGAR